MKIRDSFTQLLRHIERPGRRPLFYRGRHIGHPAAEHAGAHGRWSPKAEINAAPPGQPEETPVEAVERGAVELVDHWTALKTAAAGETNAEMDALGPKLNPLFQAVEEACLSVLDALGITEADIDEYVRQERERLQSQTAQHSVTELRRLVAASRAAVA